MALGAKRRLEQTCVKKKYLSKTKMVEMWLWINCSMSYIRLVTSVKSLQTVSNRFPAIAICNKRSDQALCPPVKRIS